MMMRSCRRYSTGVEALIKTPLYSLHVEHGATLVPYAGFAMPVLYKGQSHIESHNWTRSKVGIFDVSHMLQHRVKGNSAAEFLQKITPSDLKALEPFTSTLSVLLNDQGGVIDDCIITKHDENEFYIVTNAGCRDKDTAFIKEEISQFGNASHENFEGTLLAIQGPQAAETLQKFTKLDLTKLYFGNSAFAKLEGFTNDAIHIARSGYTGEDGFELSIPVDHEGLEFTKALLELEQIKPIGLAARDSLRLEAGMCLYGHELNEQTTPVESSLNWLIAKSRRTPETAGFNGSDRILSQIQNPKSVSFKRVGIQSKGPSPREGNKIYSYEEPDKQIGVVCSGSPSPTLGGNVGQAFIHKPHQKSGTKILIEIRNKKREAHVAKLPFVAPKFYKPE